MDENGVKNQESLLGMREDDDWILRSLASDESKIREKLATDLCVYVSNIIIGRLVKNAFPLQ